jgi:hypothetical protein
VVGLSTYGTRLAAAGVSARNIPDLIEGAQDSAVAELEAFDPVATAGTAAAVPTVAF